jgi:hypothetical protein
MPATVFTLTETTDRTGYVLGTTSPSPQPAAGPLHRRRHEESPSRRLCAAAVEDVMP